MSALSVPGLPSSSRFSEPPILKSPSEATDSVFLLLWLLGSTATELDRLFAAVAMDSEVDRLIVAAGTNPVRIPLGEARLDFLMMQPTLLQENQSQIHN